MELMWYDREYVITYFTMSLALPKGEFHWEAEDILDQWFGVVRWERVRCNDDHPKRCKHLSSCASRLSDIALTVNINIEVDPSLIRWLATAQSNAFEVILSLSIVRV